MAEAEHENPHVAVLAFPFGTHAAPLLSLTRRLANAAPNTTFSFFSTTKSNASLFGSKPDHAFHNIKPYDVDDGVPENHVFSGHPQELIELFIKAMPHNFNKGFEAAVSDKKKEISCIMSDAFFWFLADVADGMKVPWFPLWTAGAASLSIHCYTDLIRQSVGPDLTGKEDDPVSFLQGISSALRLKDLPPEVFNGGNKESAFSKMLHKMGQTVTRATVITINSFDQLETSVTEDLKSKFKHFLTLGPFNLTSPSHSSSAPPDSYGCLQWLDSQKPASVAYISFGTVMTPPPNELAALAEALEASGVPFLWSLAERVKAHLPDGFLDRISSSGKGKVVPWAPQSKVLEHEAVGVFATHGGWNSVLESVTGGVPMICRPFFGDQKLNARLVSHEWEIGVEAKDGVFTKDGMVDALDLILSREEGKKMGKKVAALKELARKAVGPDGSSTNNFTALLEMVTGKTN